MLLWSNNRRSGRSRNISFLITKAEQEVNGCVKRYGGNTWQALDWGVYDEMFNICRIFFFNTYFKVLSVTLEYCTLVCSKHLRSIYICPQLAEPVIVFSVAVVHSSPFTEWIQRNFADSSSITVVMHGADWLALLVMIRFPRGFSLSKS